MRIAIKSDTFTSEQMFTENKRTLSLYWKLKENKTKAKDRKYKKILEDET